MLAKGTTLSHYFVFRVGNLKEFLQFNNEQLMILDNVSINTFQTLNLLFLGNYDHWVCPYLDQDL